MPDFGLTIHGRYRPLPRWGALAVRWFVLLPIARLTRGTTLGVQAVAFDDNGHVLLVRQSYTARWQFPGGGVDRGEAMADALIRELKEEANVDCDASPRLFSVYTNFRSMPGDHVALFIVDRAQCDAFPPPNREIIAHGFFPTDSLPEDTAGSVHRRLAEIAGKAPVSKEWL